MGDISPRRKTIEGPGIELQKMREPGVPTIAEFVVENTPENGGIRI